MNVTDTELILFAQTSGLQISHTSDEEAFHAFVDFKTGPETVHYNGFGISVTLAVKNCYERVVNKEGIPGPFSKLRR